MPRYVWEDQKAIWTSPFHTSKANAKWWAAFGTVTLAAIATDKWTVKQLPNTSDQVSVATTTSRLGAAYSLIPISAGFYMIGTGFRNDRFRETGLLGFEAMVDTTLVETVIKAATDRARPLQSDGKGHFWDGTGLYNASFPSGHAINSWALASVVAHQYPHPRIIPILAYAGATLIVSSRVAARKHFPGDVIAGSAMGWFIGDYIYGKRHNRLLDQRATFAQKVLSHIRVGPLSMLP
jgi:membrane-associated phospholipid phosphatase